jgi:hypothetical protein
MAIANRSNPYQPDPSGGVLDVFDRLFVSTPAYRGEGQPPADGSGLRSLFASLIGSSQPAYRTAASTPTQPDDDGTPSDSCTDSVPVTVTGGDGAPLTIVIARD